eukprot:TRINITY_DN124658_c0_g1_i1.p1 TRINITY_DN124658_c0_g1~~TRINITY_DN124658_c0_g1_i1.p1  ORF type:complete len:211 (+),score=54.71 TRINITY_DN124658_c0_g1_i1:88-720(+)
MVRTWTSAFKSRVVALLLIGSCEWVAASRFGDTDVPAGEATAAAGGPTASQPEGSQAQLAKQAPAQDSLIGEDEHSQKGAVARVSDKEEAGKAASANPGEDLLAAMMKEEVDERSQQQSFAQTRPDGTIFGVGPHGVRLSDSNTPVNDLFMAQAAQTNPYAAMQVAQQQQNQVNLANQEAAMQMQQDRYIQQEMAAPAQLVPLTHLAGVA